MSIVSNTGPLIALAKVAQLSILEQLFQQVHIPPAVHRELLAKAGPESAHLDTALATFIAVEPAPPLMPDVEAVTRNTDPGERAAIALARTMGLPLLIDDRLGRHAAHRLHLSFIGTAGVLVQAKQAGLLPLVRPVLEDIRQRGYWLSDRLLAIATQLAGETPSS